ncbi:MAG: deazapurine DNA modification protein DpdA family protein [Promethearchaeota archaeon]
MNFNIIMEDLKFFAVCHGIKDNLNKSIELLGKINKKIDPNENFIFRKVNLLISFSHIYKNGANIYIPNNYNEIMIDSGAYDMIIKKKNKDYPFSVLEYFNNIKRLTGKNLKNPRHRIPIKWVVGMDYICLKDENKKNLTRINKTVSNIVKLDRLIENDKEISFKLLPVIQGYTFEEYKKSIDLLYKKGILQKYHYYGIGSLVARRSYVKTRELIKKIIQYLEHYNLKFYLHLFGVNLNVIKDPMIIKYIRSIDSLAWTFPYLYGRVKMFTGSRLIELNTQKQLKEFEFYYVSLNATLEYIRFLDLIYKNISKIYSVDNKLKINNKTNRKTILNKKENHKNNIEEKNTRIKTAKKQDRNIINKALVFTGTKLIFLEPKSVPLSDSEYLYTFRNNLLRFICSNFSKSTYIFEEKKKDTIQKKRTKKRYKENLNKDTFVFNLFEKLNNETYNKMRLLSLATVNLPKKKKVYVERLLEFFRIMITNDNENVSFKRTILNNTFTNEKFNLIILDRKMFKTNYTLDKYLDEEIESDKLNHLIIYGQNQNRLRIASDLAFNNEIELFNI